MKQCRGCLAEFPLGEFKEYKYKGKIYRRARCRACRAIYGRADYKRHAVERAARKRAERAAVPVEERQRREKRRYLLRKYGLTPEQYNEMVEEQKGRCAICWSEPNPGRILAVDHNHETGKPRDLLCDRCNLGLGMIEDKQFVRRAYAYLHKHGGDNPGDLGSIVVDLDGILSTNTWPNPEMGELIPEGQEMTQNYKAAGHRIIIWTSRPWHDLNMIEGWLLSNSIPFDMVVCGKPLMDLYIDNRARRPEWVDKYE